MQLVHPLLFGLTVSGAAHAAPDIAVSGSCPGLVTIDLTGATPNKRVALLTGDASGTSTVPGGACAGTGLDVGAPSVRFSGNASATGTRSVTPNVPAAGCAAAAQWLDLDTCQTSPAVSLTPCEPVDWYLDADGDGFGDPAQTVLECAPPVGYVADDTDCDDLRSDAFPGAAETCNGTDDNCDLLIDDADPFVTGQSIWYVDMDGDGAGDDATGFVACFPGPSEVGLGGDCNDLDNTVHPTAADPCDGIDQDCTGAEESCTITVAEWDSVSGLMPDEAACAPFTRINESVPEDATLSLGSLNLANNIDYDVLAYLHGAAELDMPPVLTLEAEVQYNSGGSLADSRTGATLGFKLGASQFKNTLLIEQDQVFLLDDENVRGPTWVGETDDARHRYRMEVDTSTFAIDVYRDDIWILSGSAFLSSFPVDDEIYFGDGSVSAHGSSDWESVAHNALDASLCGTAESEWVAANGVFPDDLACAPWVAWDQSVEDAALYGPHLIIANDSFPERLVFSHGSDVLEMPAVVQAVGRVRVLQNATSVPSRAGTNISIELGASQRKNSLHIGDGEVFILSDEDVKGPTWVGPTTDAVHTYSFDVDTTSFAIDVYRDGELILQGEAFVSPYEISDEIEWGEGSLIAAGASAWEAFSHNALAAGLCP